MDNWNKVLIFIELLVCVAGLLPMIALMNTCQSIYSFFTGTTAMPDCLQYQQIALFCTNIEIFILAMMVMFCGKSKIMAVVVLALELPLQIHLFMLNLTNVSLLSQEWRYYLTQTTADTDCSLNGSKMVTGPYYLISFLRSLF